MSTDHVNADHYSEKITDMLEGGAFDFAEETLQSILDFITDKGYVTEGQKTAVDNIEASYERNR